MTQFKDAIDVFYELTQSGKVSWDRLGSGAGWQTSHTRLSSDVSWGRTSLIHVQRHETKP